MEVFREECFPDKYKDNKFFQEWHQAIIRDFDIFKQMLEKYADSDEKRMLLVNIDIIQEALKNQTDIIGDDKEVELSLRSTPNHFQFSFYSEKHVVPTFVLLSKDYKHFLIGEEETEMFDEPDMNEDVRYGLYNYDWYSLKDGKVKYYHEQWKEYTKDFFEYFRECYTGNTVSKSDDYCRERLLRKFK